jgi:hypothetical protein
MQRPVWLVCVFNIYRDMPLPGETPEQKAYRTARQHCVGFTAQEAVQFAEQVFYGSCDHNWTIPVLIGEFTTTFRDGFEVLAVPVICPHCGGEC